MPAPMARRRDRTPSRTCRPTERGHGRAPCVREACRLTRREKDNVRPTREPTGRGHGARTRREAVSLVSRAHLVASRKAYHVPYAQTCCVANTRAVRTALLSREKRTPCRTHSRRCARLPTSYMTHGLKKFADRGDASDWTNGIRRTNRDTFDGIRIRAPKLRVCIRTVAVRSHRYPRKTADRRRLALR